MCIHEPVSSNGHFSLSLSLSLFFLRSLIVHGRRKGAERISFLPSFLPPFLRQVAASSSSLPPPHAEKKTKWSLWCREEEGIFPCRRGKEDQETLLQRRGGGGGDGFCVERGDEGVAAASSVLFF